MRGDSGPGSLVTVEGLSSSVTDNDREAGLVCRVNSVMLKKPLSVTRQTGYKVFRCIEVEPV